MYNCKSAYQVVAQVWEAFGPIAKEVGCAIATTAAGTPEAVAGCIKALDKVEEVADQVMTAWNRLAGSSTWATIGPRSLELGTRYKGTLFSTGSRLFITPLMCTSSQARLEITRSMPRARPRAPST
jgi:hypothetical protein